MKSKTSLFNKALARRNLTGHMGLWAGCLLVWLIALPLNVYFRIKTELRFTNLEHLTADELLKVKYDAMVKAVGNNMELFVVLSAGMALLCAVVSFSYLFHARSANMMHTYPVSRMSLFRTNYVTGLVYQIITVLAGVLAALVTGAGMGALSGAVLKQYLFFTGAVVAEIIFFYSLAVCVLMFCGNMVSATVFFIIVNFLYAGVLLTMEGMIETVCYGVDQGLGNLAADSVLTPVAYLMGHVMIFTGEEGYLFTGARVLAGYLAAAVALVIIAVAAYQKKHLETAGDVFTVNWLKPLFRWIASAGVSATCALIFLQMTYQKSIGAVLVSGIISGAIAFFAAQMLIERTLRVFTKKRIREGIIFILCMCVVYIGLDMDLMGLEKKIPAADEIRAVSLNGRIQMYAMSEEEIDWIRDIHSRIIDSKEEFESSNGMGVFISMEYYLKNGKNLRRYYNIPSGSGDTDVIRQLDEYADRPDIIMKQYFGIHYPDIEVISAYVNDQGQVRVPEQKDVQELYRAVVKDVQEGNFKKFADPDGDMADTVSDDVADTMDGIYITFEVLDKKGFITPETLFYYSQEESSEKGETPEIWLSPNHKHLVKKLREMGYLENKMQ